MNWQESFSHLPNDTSVKIPLKVGDTIALVPFNARKGDPLPILKSYASRDGNGGKQDVELDNFLEYYVNGKRIYPVQTTEFSNIPVVVLGCDGSANQIGLSDKFEVDTETSGDSSCSEEADQDMGVSGGSGTRPGVLDKQFIGVSGGSGDRPGEQIEQVTGDLGQVREVTGEQVKQVARDSNQVRELMRGSGDRRASTVKMALAMFSRFAGELVKSLEPRFHIYFENKYVCPADEEVYTSIRDDVDRQIIKFTCETFPDPSYYIPTAGDFQSMVDCMGVVFPGIYAPEVESVHVKNVRRNVPISKLGVSLRGKFGRCAFFKKKVGTITKRANTAAGELLPSKKARLPRSYGVILSRYNPAKPTLDSLRDLRNGMDDMDDMKDTVQYIFRAERLNAKEWANLMPFIFTSPKHIIAHLKWLTGKPIDEELIEFESRTDMVRVKLELKFPTHEFQERLERANRKSSIEHSSSKIAEMVEVFLFYSLKFEGTDNSSILVKDQKSSDSIGSPHILIKELGGRMRFNLIVQNSVLYRGISLSEAVVSLMAVCFSSGFKYPEGGHALGILWQRVFLGIVEETGSNGSMAAEKKFSGFYKEFLHDGEREK